MRTIVVAGLLTVALLVAVLGAIGAQLPVFGPSQSISDEFGDMTQRVPPDAPVHRNRS